MNCRILLLEDDPVTGTLLLDATREVPADVDLSTTLAHAKDAALSRRYDLWLFDANLPDGSSIDLLKWLRNAGHRTVAIAHTASNEASMASELRAAGFQDILIKPMPVDLWVQALQRTLTPAQHSSTAYQLDDAAPSSQVWDDAGAAMAMGGDLRNIAELRQLFLKELPSQRDAILAGDAQTRLHHLHRLQASCRFVGAAQVANAAKDLHARPDDASAMFVFMDAVSETLTHPP